jgi:GTPase SAR1 family protein
VKRVILTVMHNSIPQDLIEKFQKGDVIIVTGTGVTAATVPTEQRDVASWVGLIRHGLEFCKKVSGSNPRKLEVFVEDLEKQTPDLGDLFDAANYVSRVLKDAKPPKFAAWLKDAVNGLTVADDTLIQTIAALRCPIITLNYDKLIEQVLGRSHVHWTQLDMTQGIINKEFDYVLHLHGHYAEPETVILSQSDYARIRENAGIQAILAAVALRNTLVFVGCGETLNDPNWQPMLSNLEAIFAENRTDSLYRHYLLVRDSELQKYKAINSQVVATAYGPNYSDLIGFLKALTVPATKNANPLAVWVGVHERYLLKVRDEYVTHSTITNYQMHTPIPFERLFSSVRLVYKPKALRTLSANALDARAQVIHFEKAASNETLDAMVVFERERRLFVLGKPGAGKTVFLKKIMRHTLDNRPDAVPFFVTLRSWAAAGGGALIRFLETQLLGIDGGSFEGVKEWLVPKLERGEAVVLLDGLDEVNLENGIRDSVVQAIKEFCMTYPLNKVVLTCRITDTEYDFDDFQYVQIADFRDEQVSTFVKQWFTDQPDIGTAFLERLREPQHKGFRDLTRVPLLLTLLCVVFEERIDFPVRKSKVYDLALDTLINKWDFSRVTSRSGELYRGLSLERKHDLFGNIAYDFFLDGQIFFDAASVAKKIESFLSKLPETELFRMPARIEGIGASVLRAIEEHSGVLFEHTRGVYSFAHVSFQEYYTARHIAQHATPTYLKQLIDHVTDPKWRETIMLTASELSEKDARSFLELWKSEIQGKLRNESVLHDALFGPVMGKELANKYLELFTIRIRSNLEDTIDYILDGVRTRSKEVYMDLAREFDLDLILDLNLVCNLARDLDIDHDITHARARARELYMGLGFEFDRDLDDAVDFTRARARTLDHDINVALSFACTRARDLNLKKETIRKLEELRSSFQNDSHNYQPLRSWLSRFFKVITQYHTEINQSHFRAIPELIVLTVCRVDQLGTKICNWRFNHINKDLRQMFTTNLTNLYAILDHQLGPKSAFRKDLEHLNLGSSPDNQSWHQALNNFRLICNTHLNNILKPLDEPTTQACIKYLDNLLFMNECLDRLTLDPAVIAETRAWFVTPPT